MSYTRDLAIEIFGEQAGAAMTSADLYQRLSADIAQAAFRTSVEVSINPEALDDDIMGFLEGFAARAEARRPDTLLAEAYATGRQLQTADAQEADIAKQHTRLARLAAIHRAVKSPKSTTDETA